MNPIDHQLDRIFRAAAKAETDLVAAPPYGLETRVMAAWRGVPEFHFWDARLLARGLVLAVVIMGVSLWPALTLHKTTNPFSDCLQLAASDPTVSFDNTP